MNQKIEVNNIFVYGTLREGEGLAYNMEGAERMDKGILNGFKMYSLIGYPFIIATGEFADRVHGEMYSFTEDKCRRLIIELDQVELGGGFNRTVARIDTQFGLVNAWIYYMRLGVPEKDSYFKIPVPTGDWVKEGKHIKGEELGRLE